MPARSQALRMALAGWLCRLESGPATTPWAPISASHVEAELLGLGLPHDDDRAGAVGDLRRRAGGDGAVLGEGRAQPDSDSVVVSARMPSSSLELDRVALALRDRDGDDLVVEEPVLPRLGGELVAAGGEGVLLLAGEWRSRRRCAASVSEPIAWLVKRVVEAVVGHAVLQGHVAVLEAVAALGQQVRGVGHRLLAAGDDDVELAGADELVGERDRVEAREADLVDR